MSRRGPVDGPITLRRLERAIATLCRVMGQLPDDEALKLVPIYEFMQREVDLRRSTESVLAAARARGQAGAHAA